MSTSLMQGENRRRPKGMQFISKMTQMGEYFYLRVPKERNETAKQYHESKRYLLVNFTEVEVEQGN